jgi:hypothetical protein
MDTPETFEEKMRKIFSDTDTERAHGEADDLMCDLLRALGYGGGIDIFEKEEKWYS